MKNSRAARPDNLGTSKADVRPCLLAIVAIFVGLMPCFSLQITTDHEKSHATPKDNRGQADIHSVGPASRRNHTTPVVAPVNPPEEATETKQTKGDQHGSAQDSHPASTREWILIIVNISYVAVTLFTLRAIKDQATIAKENVARLERPWLVAATPQFTGGSQVIVVLQIVNYGKSPAWITEATFTLKMMPVSDLPKEPDYGAIKPIHPVNLPPGESCRTELFQDVNWNQDEPKGVTPILWGFVKYRDVFQTIHETRFCFYFSRERLTSKFLTIEGHPEHIRMCGSPSYNLQT